MKTVLMDCIVRYSLEMQLPRVIPLHEIPILKLIHGDSSVEVVDECGAGDDFVPSEEVRRLREQYAGYTADRGTNPAIDALPDGSRDIEAMYSNYFGGEIPEATVEEIEAEGTEDLDDAIPEALSEREVIINRLTDLGIPFGKTTPTKHLQTLLDSAVEPEEGAA